MKWIESLLAIALAALGAVHAAFTTKAFDEWSDAAVWFYSGGLVMILAGLSNLARAHAPSPKRLIALTAFVGAAGIISIGALLGLADRAFLQLPQVIAALALGALLALASLRDLIKG